MFYLYWLAHLSPYYDEGTNEPHPSIKLPTQDWPEDNVYITNINGFKEKVDFLEMWRKKFVSLGILLLNIKREQYHR